MCCLTYEHDAYLAARKRFPREGKTLRTSVGNERVVAIDIWRNLVTLQDENRQRRVIDLDALKEETAAQPAATRETAPAEAAAPLPTPAQQQRPPRRPRKAPEQRPE
jgi:cell fate regulator YaaT (PSP1 superfamily)